MEEEIKPTWPPPEHVRVFLSDLSKSDVEILHSGITILRGTFTVMRFLKWVLATAILGFTTMAALGDSFFKIKGWWR